MEQINLKLLQGIHIKTSNVLVSYNFTASDFYYNMISHYSFNRYFKLAQWRYGNS